MSAKNEPDDNVTPLPVSPPETLRLDETRLEAAKRSLDQGTVTPSYGPWREDIIRLLNDALATELVCILRYKRHHFTAKGLPRRRSPRSSWSMRSRKLRMATRLPSASCSSAVSRTLRPTA